MSNAGVRVGVGTRFRYDGETFEVIEMAITATGNQVVLKDHRGRVMRLAVKELLLSDWVQVIPDSPGPSSDDDEDLASVVLAQLSNGQRDALLEKASLRALLQQVSQTRWQDAEQRRAPREQQRGQLHRAEEVSVPESVVEPAGVHRRVDGRPEHRALPLPLV